MAYCPERVLPGKVIHETPLYQLIHYAPTTPTVAKTPLVIFPPWINRFYILDLTPSGMARVLATAGVFVWCLIGSAFWLVGWRVCQGLPAPIKIWIARAVYKVLPSAFKPGLLQTRHAS